MLSSPLNSDLYHLTMAQALFMDNSHLQTDCFEMFIRNCPFKSAYTLCAGIDEFIDWIADWHFTADEIRYLRELKNQNGDPVFDSNFIDFLATSKLELEIEAIKEGDLFFPNEPVVRVTGPSWQCNMVEAALLNVVNAESLIATKASRIIYASSLDGKKRAVLEFGLRRAQEVNALSLSRAAYIGGCDGTSNVLAGKLFAIPVSGTHAHSYVMHYKDELTAFCKYLQYMPENSTLLIDTYDSINGAKNAIEASKITGIKPKAVRLDSGDFAFLSVEIRKLLDKAGLTDTKIVVSNDLDEYTIQSLVIEQISAIDTFAVGTKLISAYDQPALGGVFKLKTAAGKDKIKISNLSSKTTIPGATNILRTELNGLYSGDIIIPASMEKSCLDGDVLIKDIVSVNPDNYKEKIFPAGTKARLCLQKAFGNGKKLYANRKIKEIREYAKENLSKLDIAHQRLYNPHLYIAGIEKSLYDKRMAMIKGDL